MSSNENQASCTMYGNVYSDTYLSLSTGDDGTKPKGYQEPQQYDDSRDNYNYYCCDNEGHPY